MDGSVAMANGKRGVVAIVSGGLDSVVMAHHLAAETSKFKLEAIIAFDYGQKHRWKELRRAESCVEHLGTKFYVVSLPWVGTIFEDHALLDSDASIPAGPYDELIVNDVMVVPHRNALMILVASMHAIAAGLDAVGIGVHGGDHPIYPDCRPSFMSAAETMLRWSFPKKPVEIVHPFLNSTKAQIVQRGAELGVDFSETWSCYRGDDLHCGTCPTCIERRQAFELAGVEDPTIYTNG